MIYQVIKSFEYNGKTLMQGDLIKLTVEELKLYGDYVSKVKFITK